MKHSKAFIKLKKEIEKLPDFDRGYYGGFWVGYIHGIHDYHKYGKITEKEGMELEKFFEVKIRNIKEIIK